MALNVHQDFGPKTSDQGSIETRKDFNVSYTSLEEVLYGVTNIGQHEYRVDLLPNGLNPSVHKPSLTFLISIAKVR